MDENLYVHILSGEATAEEKEIFYRKLQDDKEEEKLFYEMKSLWLRSSMPGKNAGTDAAFHNLWKRIEKSGKFTLPFKKWFQYAAVAIMLLGMGSMTGYLIRDSFIETQYDGALTYTSLKGSVSIVEFQDGTKVWLNSDSKITYRDDRRNKQRLAELTGEGYFEVVHRKGYPFLVKAGQITVRDLGTTFNVKAYPEDEFIETSLVEGEADILSSKGNALAKLEPGESALYFPTDKKIELRTISDNVLSAWREGKFVIRDQRLEDIFRELSRWYDVEFTFEDESLRDYRFTGSIKKSTTVQHVLKMLKVTADFEYRITDQANGSDKVVIY